MKVRFVGDIHGKTDDYKSYSLAGDGYDMSVQVGDFGFGFFSVQKTQFLEEWQLENPKHKFIRGNHDSPAICKKMPGYINDGQILNDMMFVGGAWSIDHYRRTEGVSWWRDEELSVEELNRMVDIYDVTRPEIMVTHDAPSDISYEMFVLSGLAPNLGKRIYTRTGQALQAMFEIHQPKFWVFGHWHHDLEYVSNGTHFVCVGELGYVDIDTENFEIVKKSWE